MFAAAVATDQSVRNDLISGIRAYVTFSQSGVGDWPFAVLYDPNTAIELTVTNQNNNDGINRLLGVYVRYIK